MLKTINQEVQLPVGPNKTTL